MDVDVHGTVAEGFEPVREAFARNFERLGERGAALAVYQDGHRVVDLWGGTKDVDGTAPWQRDTAQIVRSATKGVAAAVLLMLHERGLLDLDAPVGRLWPEFKAHGKEGVLVRHVLGHRAGLPVLDRPLSFAEATDPRRAAEALAAQAPVWEPGTDHGYHALTYGWLVDELVRRVTGRGAGEWIAAEIAAPLDLDLWVGLPDAEAHRVGRAGKVEGPEPSGCCAPGPSARSPPPTPTRPPSPAAPSPRSSPPGPQRPGVPRGGPARRERHRDRGRAGPLLRVADRPGRRHPPAGGGHRGARPRRGVGGPRPGPGGGHPLRARLHAARQRLPFLAPGSFGHPGRGGSLGFADPESGLALGYVTNGFRRTVTADPRAQALIRAVRECLGA